MKNITLIAAVVKGGGIGLKNKLPVRIPGDLPRFKRITLNHTVIMGRVTLDSFGGKPLPNRRHIILTRDKSFSCKGVEVAHSKEEALALLKDGEENFCIGGGEIFEMFYPDAQNMYLTDVDEEFESDTFFPDFNRDNWEVVEDECEKKEAPFDFKFNNYIRIKNE